MVTYINIHTVICNHYGLVAIGIVIVEIKCFKFITWPRVKRVLGLNGLKFLIVSPHFATFCGHRPCSSDTAAIIVYITLQDYVIKGSGDFMNGNYLSPPCQSWQFVNGYIIILVCLMILHDYVIIRSYDFMGRSHSK